MGRAYANRKDSMAKTAAAKTKIYSRYGRELYVCAKAGDASPESNSLLKALIARAKKDQVPSHVIERALEKASGAGSEDYAPARYEGYGPSGVAIIVECLTDNPTRTFNEVRNCFTKTGCTLGTAGSVAHTFDHLAIYVFDGEGEADEEKALEAFGEIDFDVDEIQFVPQAMTALEGEDRATIEKLVELLDDCDDVQRIYHSGELA